MNTYIPSSEKVIHMTSVDFTKRGLSTPIHLVQYDKTLPILKVDLYKDSMPYAIPSQDIVAHLRWSKPDRTFVIANCLGMSEDSKSLYFLIDEQMTSVAGHTDPVVELYLNGAVINSSSISVDVDRNPVQDSDIESTYEYTDLVTYRNEAESFKNEAGSYASFADQKAREASSSAELAGRHATTASEKATAAARSAQNANTDANRATERASAADSSATLASQKAAIAVTKAGEAAQSASDAAASEGIATQKASDASDSAAAALESQQAAAASEQTATEKANYILSRVADAENAKADAETAANTATNMAQTATNKASEASESATLATSYAVGGTGTRNNEDTDNAAYYYEQTKRIEQKLEGTLRPGGTILFSELPDVLLADEGIMYNIKDEFQTTSDFREGEGHTIPAGANIYKDKDGYWDVLAGTAVTGVKGSAETLYRQGNVEITKANIGLNKVENFKAVSTESGQELTEDEKSAARTNIGAGTYSLPTGGISKSDLSSNVRDSLGKADSALQEHQDISGKQDKTDDGLNTSSKTVVGAINETFAAVSTLANFTATLQPQQDDNLATEDKTVTGAINELKTAIDNGTGGTEDIATSKSAFHRLGTAEGKVIVRDVPRNRLNITATNQTKNGVTIAVNEDGTMILNGTASENTSIAISSTGIIKNQKMAFSMIGSDLNGAYLYSDIYKPDNSYCAGINSIAHGGIYDFSNVETKSCIVWLMIASGASFTNFVCKPMLEEIPAGADESDYPHAYVPYDEWELRSCGKNLLKNNLAGLTINSDGLTFVNYKDGSFKVSGTTNDFYAQQVFRDGKTSSLGLIVGHKYFLTEGRGETESRLFLEKSASPYNQYQGHFIYDGALDGYNFNIFWRGIEGQSYDTIVYPMLIDETDGVYYGGFTPYVESVATITHDTELPVYLDAYEGTTNVFNAYNTVTTVDYPKSLVGGYVSKNVDNLDTTGMKSAHGDVIHLTDCKRGKLRVDAVPRNMCGVPAFVNHEAGAVSPFDGGFSVSGTNSYLYSMRRIRDDLVVGKRYSLSCDVKFSDTSNYMGIKIGYGTIIDDNVQYYLENLSVRQKHISFTFTAESHILNFGLYPQAHANNDAWGRVENIMLEEINENEFPLSSYPHAYVPFGAWELRSCGKNIIGKLYDNSGVDNYTGVVESSGGYDEYFRTGLRPVEPDTDYVISNNGVTFEDGVVQFSLDKSWLSYYVFGADGIFHTANNCHWIALDFDKNVHSITDKLQIEKGTVPTNYEAPVESSITITPSTQLPVFLDSYEPETNVLGGYAKVSYPKTNLGKELLSLEAKSAPKIPDDHVIYGIHISDGESNPASKVTYLADAQGMKPARMNFSANRFDYGDWGDVFFMPRPCMLNYDGTVKQYLDPDAYGTITNSEGMSIDSDAANENCSANAMMEWGAKGHIWWKLVPDKDDEHSCSFYVANYQADSDFHDWNYELGKDRFYTRIYNGSIDSESRMRSLSGKSVLRNLDASTEMARAHANGTGWEITEFVDWILINMLLFMMGKSTDTQSVFGRGQCDVGWDESRMLTTGTMNNRGLFWGSQDGASYGVKVFGMENFYGMQWQRLAGLILRQRRVLAKLTRDKRDGSMTTGYNTSGDGYVEIGNLSMSGSGGDYAKKNKFTTRGFFADQVGGNASQDYCDCLWWDVNQINFALVGGYLGGGSLVGGSSLSLDTSPAITLWAFGAGLSYK